MTSRILAILCATLISSGCNYAGLLRPSVLKQLDPQVVNLLNELPEYDRPNEGILARLFVHGGLEHARFGSDGVARGRIEVPPDQYIWKPAIVVMEHAGELELDFVNRDASHHIALMPSDGERQVLDLPAGTGGKVRVALSQPGYYWFGCPVANHATRGMLGLVIVKGEVPPHAKLDRPVQPRP